jgi:hypothetical protein
MPLKRTKKSQKARSTFFFFSMAMRKFLVKRARTFEGWLVRSGAGLFDVDGELRRKLIKADRLGSDAASQRPLRAHSESAS